MGHIDIDLTKISDPNEPAPEGNYDLLIKEGSEGKSQAGEDMASFQFQIVGDDAGDAAGKFIFENCMLEGAGARFGLWRLKSIIEAGGGNPKKPDPSAVVGAIIRAHITIEPGSGEYPDQNRITKVL